MHCTLHKISIIQFEDGMSFRFQSSVQKDITNFAIGVGDYSEEELKISANGGVSDERVLTSANFQSLSSVISALELDFARQGFFCGQYY